MLVAIMVISNAVHQVSQRNAKGLRDAFDIPERQISFAAFDSTDVGSIQAALVSKRFLRVTRRFAKFPHSQTKSFQDVDASTHNLRLAER